MTRLYAFFAGLLALAGAALGIYRKGRKDANTRTALDAAEDIAKRERKGRDAVADEKRATHGADNRDLVDRLRGRDGDWRGL